MEWTLFFNFEANRGNFTLYWYICKLLKKYKINFMSLQTFQWKKYHNMKYFTNFFWFIILILVSKLLFFNKKIFENFDLRTSKKRRQYCNQVSSIPLRPLNVDNRLFLFFTKEILTIFGYYMVKQKHNYFILSTLLFYFFPEII